MVMNGGALSEHRDCLRNVTAFIGERRKTLPKLRGASHRRLSFQVHRTPGHSEGKDTRVPTFPTDPFGLPLRMPYHDISMRESEIIRTSKLSFDKQFGMFKGITTF